MARTKITQDQQSLKELEIALDMATVKLNEKDLTISKLESLLESAESRAMLSARLHHELRGRLKEVLNSYEPI